jgi:hypothetical protein
VAFVKAAVAYAAAGELPVGQDVAAPLASSAVEDDAREAVAAS